MKIFILSSILLSTVSPTTNATIINEKLQSYVLNYTNQINKNDNQNLLLNNIDKYKFEIVSIAEKVKNELLSNNKLSNSTTLKIQSLGELMNGDHKSRYWTQWWGVVFWINLTKEETHGYLNTIYKFHFISDKFWNFKNFLDSLHNAIGDALDATNGTPISKFIDAIGTILYISSSIFGVINEYTNFNYVKSLANKGNGVLSIRLLFGFIPLNLAPGYEVRHN